MFWGVTDMNIGVWSILPFQMLFKKCHSEKDVKKNVRVFLGALGMNVAVYMCNTSHQMFFQTRYPGEKDVNMQKHQDVFGCSGYKCWGLINTSPLNVVVVLKCPSEKDVKKC